MDGTLSLNEQGTGISVVIPCFQSEQTISRVVTGICEVLNRFCNIPYEILLVLDGPTDNTTKIASELQDEFSQCRVIELSRNFGQHAAIFAGISIARYPIIVTMDDDGQHLPDQIPILIEALKTDLDLVYGVAKDDEHGFFRNFASRLFKVTLFRILSIENAKEISAFRIFRKSLVKDIDLQKISLGTVDVILNWNTTRIGSVKTVMNQRAMGKSNYSIRSLIKFATQMVIGYSVKPLKFALFIGLIGFIVSTSLALHYLFQYFQGNVEVAGFATLTVLITATTSIQLVTLGILGEYIASIHQKSIGKPMFNLRESVTR